MHCVIYKGRKKADTYLYVEREDDFSRVPEALLALLGSLEKVMALELAPERSLARADAGEVRAKLAEQGYYLQMPPREGEEPDLQRKLKTEGFYMRVPGKED